MGDHLTAQWVCTSGLLIARGKVRHKMTPPQGHVYAS